jgi:hypothetical protein
MTNPSLPVRKTILWGVVCAFVFYPLSAFREYHFWGSSAHNLILWGYTAGYALLLIRWSGKNLLVILFPLVFLLVAAFTVDSTPAFLLLSSGILGWIRSGICFTTLMGKKIGVEFLLGLGCCLVFILFTPTAWVSWALAAWMVFLVQALYFVIFDTDVEPADRTAPDPFEQARVKADRILSV